jgi:hypothetical protein
MVDYILNSVMTDPFITHKFKLPKAIHLLKVPLLGTEEPSEHLPTPFSLVILQKKRTTDKVKDHHLKSYLKLATHSFKQTP